MLIFLTVFASTFASPEPWQDKQPRWVGQQAYFKKPGSPLMLKDDMVTVLNSTNLMVHQETDKQIQLITPEGRVGWIDKEDALLPGNAEKYYTQLIEENSDDLFAYTARASLRLQQGKHEAAIKDYTECIRLTPQSPTALVNRAGAWLIILQPDNAIADCNEAIEIDGEYVRAFAARSAAWNRKKNYDKAIDDATTAIKLDPQYVGAYSTRGNAWKNKNRFDKALADYDEAIRLIPNNALAYYNKACCYAVQGQKQQALALLEQALEKGYRKLDYIEKDNELDSLRQEARYLELLRKYKTPSP